MPEAARPLADDDFDVPAPRALRLVRDGERPRYSDEGRRIVTISTQREPRRRPSRAQQRIESRPDRIAMWAVALGLLLVFMAVATAHASTL